MSEQKSSPAKGAWLLFFGLGMAAGWALAAWLAKDKEGRARLGERVRGWLEEAKTRLGEGWEAGREAARRAQAGNGKGQT